MQNQFKILLCSCAESSIKNTIGFLEKNNYILKFVKTDDELFQLIKKEQFHLIIIDLDFEKKDGITITSEIRNIKNIIQPFIIIISDKNDDYIQITAFNCGVDDFIITPIKPILLEARISTLKKRIDTIQNQKTTPKNKQNVFFIDKEQYLIFTSKGKISLPRKEFEMLSLMYDNMNITFTREDFARMIWKSPKNANSRAIDIHISNIRKAIDKEIIKTRKNFGYTFNKNY
jgi:two-component system alkaline phosphatase synthesis response regulator PhoP